MKHNVAWAFLGAGFALLAVLVYFSFKDSPLLENGEEGVACTMEAKICPDGSSVGRQGPNCEFSPCP